MKDLIQGLIELCLYLGFYKIMCISALICLIRISNYISDIRADIRKIANHKNEPKQ